MFAIRGYFQVEARYTSSVNVVIPYIYYLSRIDPNRVSSSPPSGV